MSSLRHLKWIAAAVVYTSAVGIGLFSAAKSSVPIPDFNPDGDTGWNQDRAASDDFLAPDQGPGPVRSDPNYPHVNNGQGQPTYRVADLTNPILKPWVVAQMKKTNEAVLAGKVPYIQRERCWPAGVPEWDIYNRGEPLHFIQTPQEVLIVDQLFFRTRHIYLNVPHSKNLKPSWDGESVGHYEDDELVVDTVGLNDRTFVDNYRTPHTTALHVVERFKMIDGGKSLQVSIRVEDPGAFTMAWGAKQTWKREKSGPLVEEPCEPENDFFFGYDVVAQPRAKSPDF